MEDKEKSLKELRKEYYSSLFNLYQIQIDFTKKKIEKLLEIMVPPKETLKEEYKWELK
jgi:hypothetical protein